MNKLSALRKKIKATQENVAAYLGCSKQAVAFWESGKNEMDYKTLFKLADYFGVSIDYILGHKVKEDADMLTKDESALIDNLRKLSPEDRKYIKGLIDGLVRKAK